VLGARPVSSTEDWYSLIEPTLNSRAVTLARAPAAGYDRGWVDGTVAVSAVQTATPLQEIVSGGDRVVAQVPSAEVGVKSV
jgi:hypothetical protein